MLLYNIFLEVDARRLSSSYQDTLLTRTELEFALKKATSCYRLLQNSKKVEAYQHFLNYFEQAMQTHEEKPLLPLLLGALLDERAPLQAEMVCEAVTQLFYLNTQYQSNILALAFMGETLVDQPIAFASFLRCLCLRDMSEQKILSTHLLHHFFRYNLNTLGRADNPVSTLFQLLRAFPGTVGLARIAHTITSQERGFTSYALDGHMSNAALITVKKEIINSKFTTNEQNLRSLYALFGTDFLLAALLQWQSQNNHPTWTTFITTLFNRRDIIAEQLPVILNRLYENVTLQQALAEILDDVTLHQLISQKNGNILCIIPFRPELIEMIKQQDLATFLQNIRQRSSSRIALIIGLVNLCEAVRRAHEDIKLLAFQHLLDSVIEEPYVLEDVGILHKIQSFSASNNYILEKAKQIEDELHTIISTQAQGDIASFDYITIEDIWRHGAGKIQALQAIIKLKTTSPTDKYGLYLCLAHRLFQFHRAEFNLVTIVDLLHVTPHFDEASVTEYERLVIELLAAIDDEPFRVACIETLDEHIQTRDWRRHHYGNQDFYQRAIQAANIGYLRWLQAEQITPTTSYDALAVFAAQNNQWPIVCHLYTQHQFKTTTVNLLLHMAVNQGVASAIALLWESGQRPTTKQIEQTFLLAVKKNDIESISNMLHYLKMPPDKIIAQAFKTAVNLEHYQMAKFINEHFCGKLLSVVYEETFKKAARDNRCELLNHLLPLSRINIIDSAFLIAARANHLDAVRCFLGHTTPPSLAVVKRAWNEAKKHQRHLIATYLASFFCEKTKTPNSPISPKMIQLSESRNSPSSSSKPVLTQAIAWNSEEKTSFALSKHRFFSSSALADQASPRHIVHSSSTGKL